MNGNFALSQYRQVGVQSGVFNASPHQLVTMLMNGALDRISTAKGHMVRKETAQKGERIGAAIAIINGLRTNLNMDNGGEIAANLANLYDYMSRQLLDANLHNREEGLDEVFSLLREIKEAWVEIPVELHYGPSLSSAAPVLRVANA